MNEIISPPELLHRYISHVNRITDDVQCCRKSCESLLNCVDEVWSGNASTQVKEKLEEFCGEYRKIEYELVNAEQALRKII